MTSPETSGQQQWDRRAIIVLGDSDTLARSEMLGEQASRHGAQILECHAFGLGEARSHDHLHEVGTVVDAVRRAIEMRADIWVPFPVHDLTREQHIRQLDLVLERHGLELLLGRDLAPCPERGFHAMDYALRVEVHAVDDLDHAALAACGLRTLTQEIETALGKAAANYPEVPHVPLPSVPAPSAPWEQRQAPLKALAERLTASGMTQAKAAEFIHGLGHRPPGGGAFTQVAVSMLIRGRYDRHRGAVR